LGEVDEVALGGEVCDDLAVAVLVEVEDGRVEEGGSSEEVHTLGWKGVGGGGELIREGLRGFDEGYGGGGGERELGESRQEVRYAKAVF